MTSRARPKRSRATARQRDHRRAGAASGVSGWDLLEGGQALLAAVSDGTTVAFRDGATLAEPRIDAELEQAGPSLVSPARRPGRRAHRVPRRRHGLQAKRHHLRRPRPALAGRAAPAGITRSIAILLEDGELVAVRAHGPEGAPHGDEQLAGAFTRGRKGQIDVAEVLLSTEYGADGLQRRATLELWPDGDDDELPCRGAGTVLCATAHEENGIRHSVAFFAWSVEGRAGLGRYEIARPA